MDNQILQYLLNTQESLNRRYPDGFVAPRFIMNVGDETGKGSAFRQLVQEFRAQSLPVISAVEAFNVTYGDRVIPCPATINLGVMKAEQIESLYDQGFELRKWMSPGP